MLSVDTNILFYGVTYFATVNVRDFAGLGFRRVWNPLAKEVSA